MRFEVLTALSFRPNNMAVWGGMSLSLVDKYRRFGGTCCVIIQILASYHERVGTLFGDSPTSGSSDPAVASYRCSWPGS